MSFRLLRQGDVLLIPIDAVPGEARPVQREQGKVVLAHGEATGHHHAVEDERAELFAPDGSSFVSVDEARELYLLVHGDEPVELVHEEHATIELEPGAYLVRRQREYQPRRSPWSAGAPQPGSRRIFD
jgi:hypothetical protein